jgi:hypothetical protein
MAFFELGKILVNTGIADNNWSLSRVSGYSAKARTAIAPNAIEALSDNLAALNAIPKPWFSVYCEANAVYGAEFPPSVIGGIPYVQYTHRPINIVVSFFIEFYNGSEAYLTDVKINSVEWQLLKNI